MSNGDNRRPPRQGSTRDIIVDSLLDLTQSLLSSPSSSSNPRREKSKYSDRFEDARQTPPPEEPRRESAREDSRRSRGQEDAGRQGPFGPEVPNVLRQLFGLFDSNDKQTAHVEEPIRTLDDLIVPMSVREQIDHALAGVKQHQKLYHDWGLRAIDPHGGCVAVSMFGPSGTGKTLCAEAFAHALDRPLMRVNYAELESKFVGDTPKNIQAVFEKAQEADAVLFFDEADSILGRRLTNVQHGVDHEVNVSRSVMLQELERFDGVVLFATNLASNYDSAFRRRMEHIEFRIPGPGCRHRLLRYLLMDKVKDRLPLAEDVDLDLLVGPSDGLTGGDLQQVVLRAARRAVMRPRAEQKLTQADLEAELARAHRIRKQVGEQTG